MSAGAASQQATQTAIEHLHELWRRCLYCVALLIVGGIAGYIFRQQIISFIQAPLHEKLYYTSPMDSFNFVMQLCLLTGFIIALPVIGYNVVRFVEPALPKKLSTRFVLTILLISYLLAAVGAVFAYYAVLPATLHFFGTIGGPDIQALISVNQYFSFVLSHVGLFAAVFQMPLILLFINYINPFGPGSLRKARKYIFVGSFAISLVIPMSPDPLSQASLALPIIILFEVSEFLIWRINRKKREKSLPSITAAQTRPRVHETTKQQQKPLALKPDPQLKPIAAAATAKPKALDVYVAPVQQRSGVSTSVQRRNFQQPLRAPARAAPRQGLISDMLT